MPGIYSIAKLSSLALVARTANLEAKRDPTELRFLGFQAKQGKDYKTTAEY
jgi:hypothetical protein